MRLFLLSAAITSPGLCLVVVAVVLYDHGLPLLSPPLNNADTTTSFSTSLSQLCSHGCGGRGGRGGRGTAADVVDALGAADAVGAVDVADEVGVVEVVGVAVTLVRSRGAWGSGKEAQVEL